MTKDGRYLSFRSKTAILMVCALTFGVVLFSVIHMIGDEILASGCQSPQAQSVRVQASVVSFAEYVEENNISSTDITGMAQWGREHPEVSLSVYKGREKIFDSGRFDYASMQNYVPLGGEEYDREKYTVMMADGIVRVSVYDYSTEDDRLWVGVVSFLICALLFMTAVLLYDRRRAKHYAALRERVAAIAAGCLDERITVDGDDELSQLGDELDEMRISIIERLESEQSAMTANAELITAISHDLRTPLTALMGYLEIIERGKLTSDERGAKYVSICMEKAQQIKDMSDQLFRYFLAFDVKRKSETPQCEVQAKDMLAQLVGEHITLITEHGFTVKAEPLEDSCVVMIDEESMRRVFDNLFSNIEKYADSEVPVTVKAYVYGGKLFVEISNACKKDVSKVETTRIGLRTNKRILEMMGGDFATYERNGRFTAIVTLRVMPEGV